MHKVNFFKLLLYKISSNNFIKCFFW